MSKDKPLPCGHSESDVVGNVTKYCVKCAEMSNLTKRLSEEPCPKD